ncbi:MAG TPA: excalibur calcium-binding domain-containing protein [Allosphingosinicella sp.]
MNSATIPLAALATFAGVYWLTPAPAAPEPRPVPVAGAAPPPAGAADPVYFSGCDEVRAAGLDPLYEGQPGYRPGMDGDGDGIACEPRRGW